MRRLVIVLALLASPAFAADPVPAALREAKTARLVNAGANLGTFSDVAQALQQWGRFTIVDDGQPADIIISMGAAIPFKGWPMIITTGDGRTRLYRDEGKHGLRTNVAQDLIQTLRKRVEDPKR